MSQMKITEVLCQTAIPAVTYQGVVGQPLYYSERYQRSHEVIESKILSISIEECKFHNIAIFTFEDGSKIAINNPYFIKQDIQ